MPVYEHRCQACRQKTSFFLRSFKESYIPVCSNCGSQDMVKLVSSFTMSRSSTSHLQEYPVPPANPPLDYYNDPRNIGRWAEKKFQDMGMEMPPEAQHMIEAARDGDMSILEKKGLP